MPKPSKEFLLLGIQVESTHTVDGQPLKLRAAKGKEGNDKTNSTAALSMIISPLFLFKKGRRPGTLAIVNRASVSGLTDVNLCRRSAPR
jgi:hypothetical protein